MGYNPDESRDSDGKWTSGGGSGGGSGKGGHADPANAGTAADGQSAHADMFSKLVDQARNQTRTGMQRMGKSSAQIKPVLDQVESEIRGRHGYNPASVDKAINNASRYQGKVSSGERSAIHRLLKGR